MFSKQPLYCCICGSRFEATVVDSWHGFQWAVCGEDCFKEKRRREHLSTLNKPFVEKPNEPHNVITRTKKDEEQR